MTKHYPTRAYSGEESLSEREDAETSERIRQQEEHPGSPVLPPGKKKPTTAEELAKQVDDNIRAPNPFGTLL